AHLDRVLVGIHEHDPAGTIEPVPPSHLEEDFATREPQGSSAHAGVHAVAPNAGLGLAVGKRRARAVAGALEKFLGVHVRAKRSHLLDISNATFVPSGLPYRMSPRHQLGNFSPLDPKARSEEHTSELQSRGHLVCRLLLEKKKKNTITTTLRLLIKH